MEIFLNTTKLENIRKDNITNFRKCPILKKKARPLAMNNMGYHFLIKPITHT